MYFFSVIPPAAVTQWPTISRLLYFNKIHIYHGFITSGIPRM